MQGLDDVRGWGSLQAQALCTASHQANVGRCRLSKGPLTAAGTQQCGGRLPPPGVAAASSQLTCTPSTVHRATWQLPSYKTGHRRRRQQTSNLFLSARPGLSKTGSPSDLEVGWGTRPGLSQQAYFVKTYRWKGLGPRGPTAFTIYKLMEGSETV